MNHDTRWQTAAPLWSLALADDDPQNRRFREPVLLRFVGDRFMDDYQNVLNRRPTALADHVACAETWRDEQAGWRSPPDPEGEPPLKLFQSVHNRFYLVAASLCCRIGGLPDRSVNKSRGESTSFVIRRLLPAVPGGELDPEEADLFNEYGWAGDRQKGRWIRINDSRRVANAEERLPLFPTTFDFEGHRRRVYAGLIPVGGRELYEQGLEDRGTRPDGDDITDDESLSIDPRMAEFDGLVDFNLKRLGDPPAAASGTQLRESLIFTLLDLVEFLVRRLSRVAAAIHPDGDGADSLSGAERELYDYFDRTTGVPAFPTWVALLQKIVRQQQQIAAGDVSGLDIEPGQVRALARNLRTRPPDAGASPASQPDTLHDRIEAALVSRSLEEYQLIAVAWTEEVGNWPGEYPAEDARSAFVKWLLRLTDYVQTELRPVFAALRETPAGTLPAAIQQLVTRFQAVGPGNRTWGELLVETDRQRAGILADELSAEIAVLAHPLSAQQIRSASLAFLTDALLDAVAAALAAVAALPAPASPAGSGLPQDAIYVIRCVYERPQCQGAHDGIVSAPSRPFRLASFFDPDAPTRTVHIRLPADTSISGLRKFPRGAVVTLSKSLRQQLERITGTSTSDLVDGNVDSEPTLNLGMVCSLSIPIITICALILLMIIVQLLNIVFWWLPLFRICLPVRSPS